MIKTLTEVIIPPGLPVSPCEQREHIELTIPREQGVRGKFFSAGRITCENSRYSPRSRETSSAARRNGWFRRLPVENLSSNVST